MEDQKINPPWSARVWVQTERGVPLVINPWKGVNTFWLPPGGKGEAHDHSPRSTAIREYWEETGLRLKALELIGEPLPRINRDDPKLPYHIYMYRGYLDRKGLQRLRERGMGGEAIKIFTDDDLRTLKNFYPDYKQFFIDHGLWPK